MAKTTERVNNRIIIILFTRDQKDYRMRVACAHIHPGERDHVEVASKDMLGEIAWTSVPDGNAKIPSTEWLVRRALWKATSEPGDAHERVVVDIGEI
jgi:hypothetical protein